MEVGGNNKTYPGRNLSNFFPHPFTFRGMEVASMNILVTPCELDSPTKFKQNSITAVIKFRHNG